MRKERIMENVEIAKAFNALKSHKKVEKHSQNNRQTSIWDFLPKDKSKYLNTRNTEILIQRNNDGQSKYAKFAR